MQEPCPSNTQASNTQATATMQSALLATLLAAMLRHVSAARCIIGTSGMDLYGREGPFVGSCPTF